MDDRTKIPKVNTFFIITSQKGWSSYRRELPVLLGLRRCLLTMPGAWLQWNSLRTAYSFLQACWFMPSQAKHERFLAQFESGRLEKNQRKRGWHCNQHAATWSFVGCFRREQPTILQQGRVQSNVLQSGRAQPCRALGRMGCRKIHIQEHQLLDCQKQVRVETQSFRSINILNYYWSWIKKIGVFIVGALNGAWMATSTLLVAQANAVSTNRSQQLC